VESKGIARENGGNRSLTAERGGMNVQFFWERIDGGDSGVGGIDEKLL